ncbi:MAG TPA: GAF domain-containing sensor histidine kinase [Actinomycetota bacterium]|nr:GAF domain-containing sensor histidine kinase [Actinomycetota bacterium]
MVTSSVHRDIRYGARLLAFVRAAPERARERQFWLIQAQVAVVTLLHLVVESSWGHELAASLALLHLPVVFYAVPITYAGFEYGLEGATLTCLWSAVLVVPNILLFHHVSIAGLGDAIFMLVVAILGTLVALAVERERRERLRAESTSQRLVLLNEVSAILEQERELRTGLSRALTRLVEVVGLRGAGLLLVGPDGEEGPRVCVPPASELRDPLLGACEEAIGSAERSPGERDGGAVRVFPLQVEGTSVGCLAVSADPGQGLREEDEGLLSAAASQIGAVADNVRLHERERERLHSYVRQVVAAQEDERARIARDLHDETAQELVVMRRELDELIASGDGLPGRVADRLEDLRTRSGSALSGLRRFGRDLRPALLDDLGLAPALEWLVEDMGNRTGIGAGFRVHGQVRRLAPEVEVALFRITQEALRNVERHAGASRVFVDMQFDHGSASISVEDDGRGFRRRPTDAFARRGHLGLLGMEERARLIGAAMSIWSQPGSGSRVKVWLEPEP